MGSVYGIGTYNKGKYQATNKGKINKEYDLWRGMIKRCYCENDLIRYPKYRGCTVSTEFLDFQTFMLWAERQIGYGIEGFQLDKDILLSGNKIYSSETCVFVPGVINMFFTPEGRDKTASFPVGVCEVTWIVSGKYYSYIHAYLNDATGSRQKLGVFKSTEEAEKAYLAAKDARGKELAEEFKATIDPRVCDVLSNFMNYREERRNLKLEV